MHICDSRLEIMLKSTVVLILIDCIGGQEMLENARCNHYPNRGTCEDRGFITKWYYDRYAHRCREFHYGGCEGNDNRFDSFEECSQACRYESLDDPRQRCFLSHDPGTCAGNFERWHFDMQIRQCICSWWSGCGGNSNMFYSYNHCMSVCGIFADNRTFSTKMIVRRFIPGLTSNQVRYMNSCNVSRREGRQYRDLFASSSGYNDRGIDRSRLQYKKRFPEKELRPNVRNDQNRGAHLTRRHQYLLHHNPYQQRKVISNHFKPEPRQGYSIHVMVPKHDHMSEASDGAQMSQRRRTRIKIDEMRGYKHPGQLRGKTSYSRPQEVPQNSQVILQNTAIYSTVPTPEHLHAKQIEAYIQQLQAYERARAEALRERDRIIQQRRRDEYERAMMIYKQELQRYQQAIQSAQNRISKERSDDTNQQQMSLQGQYLNSGQSPTFFNGSSPENVRTSEEIRREKLKNRKLLNFEKLKQIEKNRKLLKTISKPLQQIQQQQNHTWSESTIQEQQLHHTIQPGRDNRRNLLDSEYGRQQSYTPQSQHQQVHLYQTSSDSYQVQGLGQRKVSIYNDSNMSVASEPSRRISQPNDHRVTEQLAIPRIQVSIEPDFGRSITNQSTSEGSWRSSQVQPDAEHFPFGMVIAADRLPDRQDVRVAETISARPLPTEDLSQERQTVAIEDYEDENYTYDQQTENGHIPTEHEEGQWSLSIVVQPTSRSNGNSTGAQKMKTIRTTTAVVEESEMVPAVVEIAPFEEDVKADEDHNVEVVDENQNDEEIMFWRGQA
ncbi:unnamed protein product [Onchocerca flexuosa]|uniref:BPTI/Kunitz inhibitor domain-containing protein n=1 Tax=Onchocerca flexuosa TaxID=387005 RepID=A0A183GYR4_9BILA|nr:unnamed protein product [Onchocerca flexuosa]